jgi:poly(beta-D-mannuronate) lyase
MKALFVLFLFVVVKTSFATDHLAATVEEAVSFLKKAKAGDKILLKNGTYKNETIRFQNSNGTKAQQIIFTAETPGKVFFEGNSTLSFSGDHITVNGFTWRKGGDTLGTRSVIELRGSYTTLSDCAIISYNNKQKDIDNKWVSIYGEYNTVTRCLFKDKDNLGATLTVWLTPGKEAHHTISYNHFDGRQNGPNEGNGLESIRIGDSKTSFENAHCVVALNIFEKCDGEIEIISNKSFHNSYLHNSFINSNGGLTLRHGNECLVDGNFFDGKEKPKSYGVRFIGEGHVAINNYFLNLHGAPNDNFRAPVSLVTGIVNTPINGYFQVKRAVISDNIFINCETPNIRMGATPNREGAILVPDTISIKNNVFFDDKGLAGNVYEEIKTPRNLTIQNNKIIGKNLTANGSGLERLNTKGIKNKNLDCIVDRNNNTITSIADKAILTQNTKAGASWVEPGIAEEIKKRKYTYLNANQVGPMWSRK